MKYGAKFFLLFLSLFILNCADCDGENPTVRLINNGTGKADIQVKTSGGNTININNVLIGVTSEKKSFDEGDVVFTINVQGVNDPIEYSLKLRTCRDYTVNINEDNSVEGTFKERD